MYGLDILLIAFVVALLPICAWKPWIGVLVFAWLGYMNPHRIVGGVAYNMPFSKLVAAATLVGLLFTKERYRLPRRLEVYLLAAMWLIFMASTLFAAFEPVRAWIKFSEVSKILLMTGVTMVLFQDRGKLRLLLLVMALSIGFLGIRGAFWGFTTGLQERLFGPPESSVADNNAIGFAFTIILPLLAGLRQQEKGAPLRLLLLVAFGLSIIALFATYSRGAFVGLWLVLVLIAVEIRTKDLALLGTALAALVVIYFAPQQWTERMQTITPTAYKVDSSGIERMKSWYVAYRLGLDHPLLGAGFSPFSPAVYLEYLPGYSDNHDAHNHFLQVFAEHGFTGLGLFVALLVVVLLRLWHLARADPDDPQRQWIRGYASMIGIAVIAFAVGGAFINMPYFDLFLQLVACTVALQEIALSPQGSGCVPLGESPIAALVRRGRNVLRPS